MRAHAVLTALAVLLAAPAAAGPWPRERGAGFLSVSGGLERGPLSRVAVGELYGEYGLTRRITLGAHLRREAMQTRADLLARWHPDLSLPLAVGVTLGGRLISGGEAEAQPRRIAPLLAAHLGHGVDTWLGNLWARVDLQAIGQTDAIWGRTEAELSGQVGLRMDWGGLAMVTLAEHRGASMRTRKLTPAVGYALTRRTTVVLDATLLPRERRIDGVRLSLWRSF